MGKEIAKSKTVNLPAHLQAAVDADPDAFKEFSGGVVSGFGILSYRGKVWRYKSGGEEQAYVNDDGDAISTLPLVLVKSNPRPSKIFYEARYTEGDEGPPRCYSADGIRPDPSVQDPISPKCAGCPNNEWGSRITEQGTKTRACADVRRVAVTTAAHLLEYQNGEREADEVEVVLLRVPPASLNPLKDYIERVLKPKRVLPYMLVTKVGFDNEASYPKLTFKPGAFLSEEAFNLVNELRESEEVARILATAVENDSGGSTDEDGDVAVGSRASKAEASESAPPASSKRRKKATVVDEDDDEEEAPRKRAADVESESMLDDDDEEAEFEEAEEPPKKASKPKSGSASKPKSKSPPATDDGDGDDLDSMLSSILGD